MLKSKVRPVMETISGYKVETHYTHPKCGHTTITFYCSPNVCRAKDCMESDMPDVFNLFGPENERNRVKYYFSGKTR